MSKKLLSILVILVIIFGGFYVYANEKLIVSLNDKLITFPDAQPFIDENFRTQVPVRFVAEAMGMNVEWEENGKIGTVTLKRENKVIDLKIGEYSAAVNGQKMKLDTAAVVKEDRTFVPLRFVSEILGAKVEWIEDTWTVKITDTANVKPGQTPSGTVTPIPSPKAETPAVTPVPTATPNPDDIYTKKFDGTVLYYKISPAQIKQYPILQKLGKVSNLSGYANISTNDYELNSVSIGYVEARYSSSGEVVFDNAANINLQLGSSNNTYYSIDMLRYTPTNYNRIKELINIMTEGNVEMRDKIIEKFDHYVTTKDTAFFDKRYDTDTQKVSLSMQYKPDNTTNYPEDQRMRINITYRTSPK